MKWTHHYTGIDVAKPSFFGIDLYLQRDHTTKRLTYARLDFGPFYGYGWRREFNRSKLWVNSYRWAPIHLGPLWRWLKRRKEQKRIREEEAKVEAYLATMNFTAYQDGADFYDENTGPIISYPEMVKGDYDMEGAKKARARFLQEHPHYKMVGNNDEPDDCRPHAPQRS